MGESSGRCAVELCLAGDLTNLVLLGDYFELQADSLVDFGKSGNV